MEKQVSVQAVAGAIRATKGITRSSKYPSSSRNVRSAGVYTYKNYAGEIGLDFWSSARANIYTPTEDIAKVVATLESRGFKVIEKQVRFGFSSDLFTTKLYVVAA